MERRQALKTTPPPAVDRALTILEVLAQSTRGLRLPEIALRLGLPKSSAHSLLVGLERRGYLQRSDTSGRYHSNCSPQGPTASGTYSRSASPTSTSSPPAST